MAQATYCQILKSQVIHIYECAYRNYCTYIFIFTYIFTYIFLHIYMYVYKDMTLGVGDMFQIWTGTHPEPRQQSGKKKSE